VEMIVATTDDREDKKIIELCNSLNIQYFKGSQDNVLSRYTECAHEFNINVIVRVCSDSPFIDPMGIKELIQAYEKNPSADLVHNKHKRGYPFGTAAELVTLKALDGAQRNAFEKHHREHVLPYIFENPDKFNIIRINAPPDLIRPDYYLAVDFPEDLELIRRLVEMVEGKMKENTPLLKIIELLDSNPDLAKINSHLHEGYKE